MIIIGVINCSVTGLRYKICYLFFCWPGAYAFAFLLPDIFFACPGGTFPELEKVCTLQAVMKNVIVTTTIDDRKNLRDFIFFFKVTSFC
jgi:hypothetical protein